MISCTAFAPSWPFPAFTQRGIAVFEALQFCGRGRPRNERPPRKEDMNARTPGNLATGPSASGLLNGLLVIGLGVLACGCAGPRTPTAPSTEAGLHCVDDSLVCRERRQAALAALLADRERSWINRPPDAAAYASGVRLFAYKKRKGELTCRELAIGVSEARGARSTLRAASDQLTPGQIARGAMLGDEIEKELKRERRRRCKT